MELDLWMPTVNPFATGELMGLVASSAEARGYRTLWVGEHVVLFDEYASSYPYSADGRLPMEGNSGLLEPLSTLSFVAARTSTIRLGTAMLLLPQRNPVYAAKEIGTLDWLSGGRLDLGIGVGWLEEEFRAVDAPWPRRGARTDEYLEVMRTLCSEEISSFSGEFYNLAPCRMDPKPIQQPLPPIHIGGESEAALRRCAAVASGWHTFNRQPHELAEPLATLDRLLAEHGRDRSEIRVTVCPYFQELDADRIEQYAEAGADAVSVMFFAPGPEDVPALLDALDPCLERARAC
jgi:probable F420-dependent oxidoreductase